jgi:5-methylcytosine-specific restriction endonuclease McrA
MCLARDPLCIIAYADICNGLAPSRLADHVIPKNAGGEDSLDNLQGACFLCHDRKTKLVDMPLIAAFKASQVSQLLQTAARG